MQPQRRGQTEGVGSAETTRSDGDRVPCEAGPSSAPGQVHRRTAEDSDASGVPLEADLDLATVHDDRHAALVAGVLEHLRQAGTLPEHVHIIDRNPLALVGFTSRPGVGSGVLAEDQNLVCHAFLLGAAGAAGCGKTGTDCAWRPALPAVSALVNAGRLGYSRPAI